MIDIVKITLISLLLLTVTTCTSFDIQKKGKYVGHYKVGKPYKINKVRYFPKEVNVYDKTGLASWYGPGFHGKKTANGETFNQRSLTAAHPTLPLPSIVRVTNLSNNKSVIVRVNDRGPFARNKRNRIIDLSEKTAEVLDIKNKGVSRVRVKLLPNATKALHQQLKIEGKRKLFASNQFAKNS
jgi:rare lipoprotein A